MYDRYLVGVKSPLSIVRGATPISDFAGLQPLSSYAVGPVMFFANDATFVAADAAKLPSLSLLEEIDVKTFGDGAPEYYRPRMFDFIWNG